MLPRIISIIYMLVIVFLIVDLWRQPGDQVKKLLWTLVLLFVPVVGLVLYLLIERSSRRY